MLNSLKRKRALRLGTPVLLLGIVVTLGAAEIGRFSRVAGQGRVSTDEYAALVERVNTLVTSISRELNTPLPDMEWRDAAEVDARPDPASTEPATIEERVARLRLEGVAWNPAAPVAFVNGQLVPLKGTVDGLKAVAITQESIRFEDQDGNSAEILLYQEAAHGEVSAK
jgi:hypothetical protein